MLHDELLLKSIVASEYLDEPPDLDKAADKADTASTSTLVYPGAASSGCGTKRLTCLGGRELPLTCLDHI